MNKLDIYITTIFAVKIIFIGLAFHLIYLKHKHPDDKTKIEKTEYWKKRVEFIFISMMSALLIYIFYPKANRINKIDYETKLLFYLFGFVLLLTERWDLFLYDSVWYKKITEVLGNYNNV